MDSLSIALDSSRLSFGRKLSELTLVYLTENAIQYCLAEIGRRVGAEYSSPNCLGGVRIEYNNRNSLDFGKSIRIISSDPSDWQMLLNRPDNSLQWVDSATLLPPNSSIEICSKLPILFPSSTIDRSAVRYDSENGVVFEVDILATILFMLTRWEELQPGRVDSHGRFPASRSVSAKQGFLLEPIVDQYSRLLGEWIKFLGGKCKAPQFRVQLSHDIDHPIAYRNAYYFSRRVGSGLITQRSVSKAIAPFAHLAVGFDPFTFATLELANFH
jgi:hypothetical protein